MNNLINVVSLKPVEVGLERGRIYCVKKQEWEEELELIRVFDCSSNFIKFCKKDDLLALRELYK